MSKQLSADYLSSLCAELSLTLRAGIPLADGLTALTEDERDEGARAALTAVSGGLSNGSQASEAFSSVSVFPKYLTDMVAVGERTGCLEQVFSGLSAYYERRSEVAKTVRNAVFYPSILLFMMLFVVVILLTKVLPIFNDVYIQLGGSMSGFASALMRFGKSISSAWLWILGALCLLALAALVLSRIPSVRARCSAAVERAALGGRLAPLSAQTRFASVTAMSLASGLDFDGALELSQKTVAGLPLAGALGACRERISAGEPASAVLSEGGLLPARYAAMLSVGLRTGTADAVMADIARRSENDLADAVDRKLSRIEPAIVILLSLCVGAVLLSVMLPLMTIMSAV